MFHCSLSTYSLTFARVVALALLLLQSAGCCNPGGYETVDTYDDFRLVGSASRVSVFVSYPEDGESPERVPAYVKVYGKGPYRISEIPEELIAQHYGEPISTVVKDDRKETWYRKGGTSSIEFVDGRLLSVRVVNDANFTFSATEEGPYFRLPMSRSDAVAVFGKPESTTIEPITGGP